MDFSLSDEQSLLKDSIDRFVKDKYGALEQIELARRGADGFSEANWGQLADLGLLAIPFDEADGGLGGSVVDSSLVMEALGRGLAPEPYLASVILAGGALRLCGTPEQRETYIPELISGTWRAAFAHAEIQARYDLFDVQTTAVKADGGCLLNGQKVLVQNARGANAWIVSARTSGGSRDTGGISLFLVNADAKGANAEHYTTVDGGHAANLTLKDVFVPASALMGAADTAFPVIEQISGYAMVAIAAEAVGVMDALTALTVDYLKQRKQFGVQIGAFQALQHRAVDMFMATEQARSMAYYAMMMADAPDLAERSRALSAAKVQINKSARFVGQQAVQLHGGIGMTMEYLGAHYFRRLMAIEAAFGDTSFHLANLVACEAQAQI